MFLSNAYLLT